MRVQFGTPTLNRILRHWNQSNGKPYASFFSKYRTTDSPSALMKEHAIPPLQARRKIQRLKFLFLQKNNKLSTSPHPYLMPLTTRHTRYHHDQSLTPYHARINAFKYSFYPRTIEEWNRLPSDAIMSIDSIDKLIVSYP